ncbi:flavin-dependent oxidoreductase [Primorskyibacter flagellatus]|uniref:Flavin-dependent oxidoreductase n=1 Tax=Primorskyibacter flagellatus TaxID=1387277 RepID=A0A917ECA1_9RHOB|nr:flavin-dependent oxidoreductase [Primorskyibacter flagellatus]GGE18932.1 flavin-dependent oxidoreductase [Primorskyibacter flagellatus]
MTDNTVLIAGGGIGGLAMALTLHQIGVPCQVYETVPDLRPLGVGINLQPNAVRELFDLGFSRADLDRIGLPAREWALLGLRGQEAYSEPRGEDAGYNWPQYSAHRGMLQIMLYDRVRRLLGPDAVVLGAKITGYSQTADAVTAHISHADGTVSTATGALLIGADGLHSALREQMYPDQPPIQWGGAVMWRGVTKARPIRTGASFVGLGTSRHRMVLYPISAPDADGMVDMNWIAEVTYDNSEGWRSVDWNRRVAHDEFVHHFEGWCFDWLDVPALLRGTEEVWEYPMIDRDPVPTWVDERVALIGDAAHVMYPTGSNGASQAIIDARVIGAKMLDYGVSPDALTAYDQDLCEKISALVLRNRGAGPFALLNLIDQRCGGEFDSIDEVVPPAERDELMAVYKRAAGFAIQSLNAAEPTIPPGAKVGERAPV